MSEGRRSRPLSVGASVRRRLGYDADAGPSTSRDEVRASSAITSTPRRPSSVLRSIRRLDTNLSDNRINEVLLQIEREESERAERNSDDSFVDVSVDEDSGDEYRPPGARGGDDSARPRPDFSGFLGERGEEGVEEGILEGFTTSEESDEEVITSDESNGDSEGEGEGDEGRGRGVGGRARARASISCSAWTYSANSNNTLGVPPIISHS